MRPPVTPLHYVDRLVRQHFPPAVALFDGDLNSGWRSQGGEVLRGPGVGPQNLGCGPPERIQRQARQRYRQNRTNGCRSHREERPEERASCLYGGRGTEGGLRHVTYFFFSVTR